ncbi:hypothetical protein [Luteimonas terrae]|uniref:YfhO family protein n=1 Tax=Luteimonas terrae TaxID=1530191 RepID=A0ABU1Y014_9GAMM|nr:hypothetical protein [Luteimonas terrae]MDR7194362.1 hypothetical protein [Luteimonas terrae]
MNATIPHQRSIIEQASDAILQARARLLEYVVTAAILLAVAAVAIGANPWNGQTSSPLDLLASYPGWGSQVEKSEIRSQERSDALDARLPQWTYARNELRAGRLPLWNDTSAGGDASLLKLTSGQLTPAFAIFSAASDPARGFYFSVLFNLFAAGFGMFVFLRSHLGLLPALFGAVMFQLCGFNVAWLYWSHMLTIIWAPWLLWSMDGLLRKPSPGWFSLTAVSTALLLLGGFPFIAQLMLGAAILYAIIFAFSYGNSRPALSTWQRSVLHRMSLGLISLAAGFLLAAVPLLTFIDWLQQFSTDHRSAGSFLSLTDDAKLLLWPWAFESPRVESSMYVGSLGAFLGVLGATLFWVRREKSSDLGLFSLAILLVSTTLVFQLLPVSVLSWVPGLGMNTWSRAISLLGLGLSIGAAVFIQIIVNRSQRFPVTARFGMVIVIGIALAAQTYDQFRYYRQFNGPTNATHFYPSTEIISYVTSNSGDFDFVIADTSYLVSGSLGGYGIREWFAHRFKTDELKRLLPNLVTDPFTTATASQIPAQKIRFEADEMELMNVRYVLAREDRLLFNIIASGTDSNRAMKPLPDLPSNKWNQPFIVPPAAHVNSISIRFATYRAKDVDGRISLRMVDSQGNTVASLDKNAEGMIDNELLRFVFPNTLELSDREYSLEIDYQPGRNLRRVTAWAGTPKDPKRTVRVNGIAQPVSLDFFIEGQTPLSKFRRVMSEGPVSLWENQKSPNGPYFTPHAVDPDQLDSKSVVTTYYSPGHFELEYGGDLEGYVVVPMEATDGWKVTVNGKSVRTAAMLGVMPAVLVQGPSRIVFSYAPESFRIVNLWLISMAALIAGLVLWAARRRSSEKNLRNI